MELVSHYLYWKSSTVNLDSANLIYYSGQIKKRTLTHTNCHLLGLERAWLGVGGWRLGTGLGRVTCQGGSCTSAAVDPAPPRERARYGSDRPPPLPELWRRRRYLVAGRGASTQMIEASNGKETNQYGALWMQQVTS